MTSGGADGVTLVALDEPTRRLACLAAVVASGTEADIREALAAASEITPSVWIEELLLQTYLFAGFPRTLNAMREWRRTATTSPSSAGAAPVDVRASGEETCKAVYGGMYERLRQNIRALHPALDDWMIEEGYGKVLSRPGLDLARRELCIVAACAATGQDRQLHSHLHGAQNVGVAPAALEELVATLAGVLSRARHKTLRLLWAKVRRK